MKKHRFNMMMLLVLVTLVSCNSNEIRFHKLNSAEWLLGKWQHHTSLGDNYEYWEQVNDSTFSGFSFFIRGNDTLSTETIRMEQQGANLYYVPTVTGQNNNQPVVFALTGQTDDQLIFENPVHDFPQVITYVKVTRDSIVAGISGTKDNEQRAVLFPMTRVK